MDLFNKRNLGIASVLFTAGFTAYVIIGGLGVNVVLTEPDNCRLIQNLQPVRYSENRIYKSLVQKKRAKKLGADTLYLPISVSNAINQTGYINGAAYDCSTPSIVSEYEYNEEKLSGNL